MTLSYCLASKVEQNVMETDEKCYCLVPKPTIDASAHKLVPIPIKSEGALNQNAMPRQKAPY